MSRVRKIDTESSRYSLKLSHTDMAQVRLKAAELAVARHQPGFSWCDLVRELIHRETNPQRCEK